MGEKLANEYPSGTRTPSGCLVVDGKFVGRFFTDAMAADARAAGYVPLDEIGKKDRGGDATIAVSAATPTDGPLSAPGVRTAMEKDNVKAAFCHVQNTLAELHAVAFSCDLFEIQAMDVSGEEMTDQQRHMCNLHEQLEFEATAAMADFFNHVAKALGIRCAPQTGKEG